ncbi:PAS domain S-box-containing protein [Desulfobaculum xiamenense]|uniref:histidine kinase n=1 Tax=Desulfobaculum xiamenense TaxID=995050 RepID=A0A846QHX6_9BACT|nr:PAS domain S-box protein [Desulfobaculum xiamenense]NJB68446.1 PAS domain S-box-containing protein [Desulfobaculum xiamenense]
MDPAGEIRALTDRIARLEQENAALRDTGEDLERELVIYRAVLEGMADGILLMQETFTKCNQSACRIWKCEKGDIIGYSPEKFAPPFQPNGRESVGMAHEKIQAALKGAPQRFYWKDLRGDGTLTDTEVFLKAVSINDTDYVVATVRDITDELRKERERTILFDRMEHILEARTRELHSSHDLLKDERSYRAQVEADLERADLELNQVFETSTDGLIVTDSHKNILKINRAFLELSGYRAEEVHARKCFEIFPCENCDRKRCRAATRLKGRNRVDYETECISATGERVACAVTATKLKESSGTQVGMVISYKNITDYRQWVQALQYSEELHRITLASISDAVFITDDDGNFHYVSPSVEGVFCLTEEEVWWLGNIHELLGRGFFDLAELEARGEIRNIELSLTDRQGGPHELMVNVKRVNIQNGTVLITCRDITEKSLAEREARLKHEQLIHAGKMVSLGILVSGVAHEVNNPNNYIMLNTQLLSRMWHDAAPVLERYHEEHGDFLIGGLRYSHARTRIPGLFDSVLEGSARIKRIVQDLKDYARHDSTDMSQTVHVNSVIKHSLNLLGNQIRKSTDHFSIAFEKTRPRVRGNYQKIEQVIINLVQNACEALPDKSHSVAVEAITLADPARVTVLVRDEGTGITQQDMQHIMDPFFTTKRDIGGTGLGLSVSQKIVQEHDGTLEFTSEPGRGTVAALTLPLMPPEE